MVDEINNTVFYNAAQINKPTTRKQLLPLSMSDIDISINACCSNANNVRHVECTDHCTATDKRKNNVNNMTTLLHFII